MRMATAGRRKATRKPHKATELPRRRRRSPGLCDKRDKAHCARRCAGLSAWAFGEPLSRGILAFRKGRSVMKPIALSLAALLAATASAAAADAPASAAPAGTAETRYCMKV